MSRFVLILALVTLSGSVLFGSASAGLYLVEGKANAGGAPATPEQAVVLLENLIIPSLRAMAEMEESGVILAGGLLSGARAGVAIVEADSNEAVTAMVRKLPFWGVLDWTVTPLETYGFRADLETENVRQIKAMKR